ncbi:MAG: VOC family protein [Burkholderiales bacterium]
MPPRLPVHDAQVPPPGQVNLDHVAHFVPDVDAGSGAFEAMGFTLPPFSLQMHRLTPGGQLVPAGTGNRTIMFRAGYIEMLAPVSRETPVAQELWKAIGRYTGVHLIAFGTPDANVDHARLQQAGFGPQPTVALQRALGTPEGEGTARFAVVRVAPGTMPEGRIQYCQHLTPELPWQPRWMTHANGAVGLAAVILCVADPAEAVARYARFSGLAPALSNGTPLLQTQRGQFLFLDPMQTERVFGVTPPSLPWIAGTVIATHNIGAARAACSRGLVATVDLGAGRFAAVAPPAAGGIIVFQQLGSPARPLL